MGTRAGRWALGASVLGSGIAFLDGTIVNVALPAIGAGLDAPFAALQWVVTSYLLTLGAFVLVGGVLGDRLGRRRVFVWGLLLFGAASVACGLAPNVEVLIAARAVQGFGAAMLTPVSLAMVTASFAPADRGAAVGAWSGLSGVTTILGPFLGGWLVDGPGWRWAFLINVPLVAAAVAMALTRVPETRDPAAREKRPDVLSGALLVLGLGLVIFPLIERQAWWAAALGVALLIGFGVRQIRAAAPLVPPALWRSRVFAACNLLTVVVYAALGGVMFLVNLRLQLQMGYSALAAGAALFPVTVVLLLGSRRTGALAGRIGPRVPLAVGSLGVALGCLGLATVGPGDSWWTSVLPAQLVFAGGLVLVVAPLTTAVLTSVPDTATGVASGVNNAVARIGSLLAVAVLPALAGVAADGTGLAEGFAAGATICAVLCALGAAAAWFGLPPGPASAAREA
jgi:EmrB/QacA subfamily drug resistance transporter